VVRSEAAGGGEHAVDMGMMLQALVPGMEHAEEADLGAEVPGIASDLEQGCGAGVEQQVINQALVLQGKWSSQRLRPSCTAPGEIYLGRPLVGHSLLI